VADELAVIEREATQPATDDRTVQIKQAASASARFPQPAPSRSRLRWLIAASLLFLFGGLAAGIVVIIRDKQGKEVARVNVPEGGSATVESEEKGKPPDKDKKQASAIPADPLLKIEPGTPLGPLALVTNPAPLPGVRSWTIETRMPRSVINAVAHRPDGLLLATAGDDGVIRLLDPKSGQMVHALVGHKARITLLAWSPDGRTLASGSWDGTVRLWDADSGRWLRTLKGLEQPWAIAWSPDGRSIMGCQNPNVLTWDAATGKTISTATLSKVVTRPAFSPDGKFMAGESEDHLVRIWDVRTGREVRTLKGHTATLYNIAWSPDGKRLASTGEDAVRLWETETGKELRKHSSPNGYYGMLAWSPDGRTLALDAAIGHHAQLDLMQVDNSVPLRTIHACNNPVGISWSPDGKTVASGGSYGDVAITDLESGAKTELYPGSANSFLTGLAWGPDSKQLATTTYQAGTRVVNSTTGEATATLTDAQAVVAWSPGKWLAASGPEAQLTLWQPRGGKRIFPAHKVGYVGSLAWSPDGKTLADAGRQSGTLRLWDGETQQLQRQWDAGKDIDILSWSPDGKLLAAGFGTGQQRQVKFWHADTGKEMRTLPGFEGVKWSSTAETLAVYYNNHLNVRLFNVKTGELGLTLSSGGVQNVAWSPDGKLLAAACTGNEGESGPLFIPVWDVATGEEVRKLDCVCLRGSINPLAWSPDGKRIAACAAQTIQLWEAETGKPDGVILPNPQYHGLTIRPDGHYRGDAKVNDAIVMVVQKADGTTETLTPHEFERKYGFKNEPDKVRLLEK
jgi:WD40 repeat protein